MKLRLLIIFLLFAASGVKAQEESLQIVEPTIGIGRLQLSLNSPIPLYKSANDIRAFDTLVFDKVTSGVDKGKFTMSTRSAIDIVPYSFHPGDSDREAEAHVKMGRAYINPTLIFRVVGLSKGKFEVILNEQTFETGIVKKTNEHTLYTTGTPYWVQNHGSEKADPAWFLYESWANYLKRLAAVSVIDPKIYDSPDGNLLLSPKGNLSFQVIYAIGEWLKVYITGEQKDYVFDEGWIRWTDGENLLLTPIEEFYY